MQLVVRGYSDGHRHTVPHPDACARVIEATEVALNVNGWLSPAQPCYSLSRSASGGCTIGSRHLSRSGLARGQRDGRPRTVADETRTETTVALDRLIGWLPISQHSAPTRSRLHAHGLHRLARLRLRIRSHPVSHLGTRARLLVTALGSPGNSSTGGSSGSTQTCRLWPPTLDDAEATAK
jgi:hypothetical protein